ncbi:hypothetical protein BCR43DRAFT_561365 [Syncephalastrum racemosum]|uniref:Pleckstrin homology domain-containing protein n=1 Tax=Syncephalastrum racemosum TaxID=13706 RepID=A0A1X2HNQ7_SYNRA|nr:hypothetical protein BCR43DRAFT_561365 [Syncephalastrum racemosum]
MLITPQPSRSSSTAGANGQAQIDVELASEIGLNLLAKLRRLQHTVQQLRRQLTSLQLDKLEWQRARQQLSETLEGKSKAYNQLQQEVWALETARQLLVDQVNERNQTLARLRMDQARAERHHSLVNQELELCKAAQDSCAREGQDEVARLNMLLRKLRQENRELHEALRHVYDDSLSSTNSSEGEPDNDNDEVSSKSPRTTQKDDAKILLASVPILSMHVLPSISGSDDGNEQKEYQPVYQEVNDGQGEEDDDDVEEADDKETINTGRPTGVLPTWMWKFTRHGLRHGRHVWLESRTLYWRRDDPTKSSKWACVETFVVENEKDANTTPRIILKAPDRDVALQCMSWKDHNRWVQALDHVLTRHQKRRSLSSLLHRPSPSLRHLASFYHKRRASPQDLIRPRPSSTSLCKPSPVIHSRTNAKQRMSSPPTSSHLNFTHTDDTPSFVALTGLSSKYSNASGDLPHKGDNRRLQFFQQPRSSFCSPTPYDSKLEC